MTELREAFGYRTGQRVRMLRQCTGADHNDIEHTVEPGAIGTIDRIEHLTSPQGICFHIVIPVYHQGKVQYDPKDDDARFIVNVFDELDGSPSKFFEAVDMVRR
jgi:hypothetical protein